MSDSPSNASAHKRSKTAVSRVLNRISSRPDSPPAEGRSSIDIMVTPADSTSRTSLQIPQRPHLSTTMSNTSSPPASAVPTTSEDEPPNSSSTTQTASIEQSVRLFKIFEALRNGDTAAISRAMKVDNENGLEGTTPLHLAVQCAETSVIEYVLSQNSSAINAKDKDGNTPLHTAANLGRAPIVKLLLGEPGINDAITNHQGKTPLDLARNPEIFQQLQLARSLYLDELTRKIHRLVDSQQHEEVETLLSDTRVQASLDVNAPELATDPVILDAGGTLLHQAARKKDLRLAQLLLLNGADPFRRDRKGKLPQDITKDERTRAILKRSPAAQAAQRSIQEKTILGETGQANVSSAADGWPAGKESREIKGYLRKWTNYTSGYKLRWFVLEDGVLSYYKHQDDAGSACRGAINMRIAKLHMDPKDKLAFDIHGKSSVKYTLKANHQVEAKRWYWALNNAIQWAKDEVRDEEKRQHTPSVREPRQDQLERQRTREPDSIHTSRSQLSMGASRDVVGSQASTIADRPGSTAPSVREGSIRISRTNTATVDPDLDDEDELLDDASSHEVHPINRDAFSITAQSAKLQLDLLEQVSRALQSENAANPQLTLSHPTVSQALASYDTAVGNLKGLLGDLLRISRDHEAHWQYRLDREQNIRRLWEDSMARVAQEQEELENRIGESEDKRKRTKKALKEVLESAELQRDPEGDSHEPAESVDHKFTRRATLAQLTNNEISDDDQSGDDEEFFDAVDAGEVEVVETMPAVASPVTSPALGPVEDASPSQGKLDAREADLKKSYRGYEDGIRKRLKLDADNRPKVSLWGVLKSMIGKDMTKMTLPVSFNEPTSLLYRVAEDMEYTTLLDTAAERADSTERMVYVAGFVCSIYASAIGRVAKPFNPLLGETFEYVRPDLGYRFVCEQVSHHPPIGAAHAESVRWDYYGESNIKSKFYGKSFEFNHLGPWFLNLRPATGGEELYTWKKATSSVVGIITGNPVVDNYGPIEIKNVTTGEVCYLDFKPRGWKASSAFQVSGRVVDTDGRTRWSIGGRWNDKIYARHTPGYEADLSNGEKPGRDQAFLVWEAHERPTGIPFNLTPFAVTFNSLPDRLRPCLAPTDSRFRPDQRAMEDGEYDFAATEKNRVEEGQRKRRRVREASGEEFQPRWFKKAQHPVTGEVTWIFNDDYWKIRDQVVDGSKNWEDERLEPIY